jgi:glycosyl transferase, family 25
MKYRKCPKVYIVIIILVIVLAIVQGGFHKCRDPTLEGFEGWSSPISSYYINLDSRQDRKQEFENGIAPFAHMIQCKRFPAIKHSNGALGCSKSHLEVIRLAKQNKDKYAIIFEDDFEFLVSPDVFKKEMSKLLDNPNVQFDVCLLAYNTSNFYKSPYPFLHKIRDAQTASGYIVQSHYYDTLIDTWTKAIQMFEQTGDDTKYTCDQSWKPLQEKDQWFCFKTRIGKQRKSYSDIQKDEVDYEV